MCHLPFGGESMRARFGLTLIELVVVLAILAAVAGVAVQSLEPLADQARYEASQNTLRSSSDAMFQRVVTNNDVTFAGFVTDIGRLPVSVGLVPELHASELWDNDRDLNGVDDIPVFALEPFDDPKTSEDEGQRTTNSLLVGAGWRGPYLQLPPGRNSLLDGFGNPIFSYTESGAPITAGGEAIAGLKSLGSNATESVGDTGYARDLQLPAGLLKPADFLGALSIRVYGSAEDSDPMATGTLYVRIYGPDSGAAAELGEIEVNALNSYRADFTNILVGTHPVRAIDVSGTSPSQTINSEGQVEYVTIHPGEVTTLELRIP